MTNQATATLHLHAKSLKAVQNRHPWLFSGGITRVEGKPAPGDIVRVADDRGRALALAYFNPHSQIRGRILTWNPEEPIDDTFWRERIRRAVRGRALLPLSPHTTTYRLINAEADGLPGLVVDRYGDYLVMQCGTMGIEKRKEQLARLLNEELQPIGIVERSDMDTRPHEGLLPQSGLLTGSPPPTELIVTENGLPFGVNLLTGHKTGLYLDQRDNRHLVCQPHFIANKELLNVFAYTGGFAVYAAAHGAGSILNIDSSVAVLEQAEKNVERLASSSRPADEYLAGDAFHILRDYRDEGRQFDVIILDPPKFAPSKGDVPRASRGYKDINWLALRLLRPGGLLATFSCSGHIEADLFQKIVFGAAADAQRDVQIIHTLTQASDHPVLLTFPESAYLKGLLCRVW
ncbi:MAG: class I SAM-dependent rRNA methyltransferase [Chloroflexi bacterium]|nr:class I SAM-dependent rRNA methyltransferase [Chloroflexota bacterium]MBP8059301.1 class I SAM-dependent rRNA methyltransferase [Chloroflexota bacterium]